MGELTEVASAKRAVRGDLSEGTELDDDVRGRASVTVTVGPVFFSGVLISFAWSKWLKLTSAERQRS